MIIRFIISVTYKKFNTIYEFNFAIYSNMYINLYILILFIMQIIIETYICKLTKEGNNLKDVIYVTGHKNPDSDSICAAFSYAEFKNKTGKLPAIPVRLGNVSQETQYILDYFGVEAPQLLKTVKLKVEDLEFDKITPVSTEISLKTA